MSIEPTRRAWVEVDPAGLRTNFQTIAGRLPRGCGMLPMVKADAYGTGVERALRVLSPLGPWGFGVATVTEGGRLRSLGWAGPVLVFAPLLPDETGDLLEWRLEPLLSDVELGAAAGAMARRAGSALAVHLEVDTGMGRFGVPWPRAAEWARRLADVLEDGGLRLRGTMTHFHSAEGPPEPVREQWRRFGGCLDALRGAGVDPGLVHVANSAAAWRFPEFAADLVRPGIRLYGGGSWDPPAAPVVAVRARVLDVRDVPAGSTVSYGATWRAPGPARLATLAIGYGDGLRRELSNRGRVLIHGRAAPVRGAVCMDVTVVDVSGREDVRRGDVATVLGRDGEAEIGVAEIAGLAGTIDYEILTGWSSRLPRVDAPTGARPRQGVTGGGR
ncbi:MAG: alanine racemase [Gemmatimonadota bacterium]|nr:alanine racemase [Gemmatimonadota bacterium]